MKILIVIQCANQGGMEQVTCNSAALLRDRGHEVRILSLRVLNGMEQLCAREGIPIEALRRYHRAGGILDIPVLLRHIRRIAPDRVWVVGHNIGAVVAGRLSGIPTFLSIHYHHAESPMWKWRIFYGIAQYCCRKIHFVSHFIFGEVKMLFHRPEQCCVFHNCLFEPKPGWRSLSARRRWNLPSGVPVVGNAGWLIPRKAFDVFLQTAAIIAARRPEVCFLIAGSGSEECTLKALADELGIAGHVVFTGWLREMDDFWSSVDLLLFNTRFDCFPTTPIEAFARGIPVVASVEQCGLNEIMTDGLDGRLFSSHNPALLAKAVLGMLALPGDRCRAITDHAKQQVERLCAPGVHLKHLTAFLLLQPEKEAQ